MTPQDIATAFLLVVFTFLPILYGFSIFAKHQEEQAYRRRKKLGEAAAESRRMTRKRTAY